MPDKDAVLRDVVDAVYDLARITIALSGKFDSKSEAVRRLSELSIPSSRIATILAMPVGDVSSAIAKSRKGAKVKDIGAPPATESTGGKNAEKT